MKDINGKKYSDDELRAIYKFFTSCRDDGLAMPNYGHLREVGFDIDSKECIDLMDAYKKLKELDEIMSETHGKAYELALMYRDFKQCLPFYLDGDGKRVATREGWQPKELEDCDDQEILESIQRMYNNYIEVKQKSFMKSLRNLMGK